MTWWGWLLVGFTALSLLGLVLLLLAVRSIARLVRDVVIGLEALRRETLPALEDTREALRKEQGANRKVAILLETAESLTGTVDSASRLLRRILTSPFVKVIAFFTGTKRTAQRLLEAADPSGPSGGRWTRARRRARSRARARTQAAKSDKPRTRK